MLSRQTIEKIVENARELRDATIKAITTESGSADCSALLVNEVAESVLELAKEAIARIDARLPRKVALVRVSLDLIGAMLRFPDGIKVVDAYVDVGYPETIDLKITGDPLPDDCLTQWGCKAKWLKPEIRSIPIIYDGRDTGEHRTEFAGWGP